MQALARYGGTVSVERLRSTQDIRRVVSARRSSSTPHLVVHTGPGQGDATRVAVVAGRRVGNAVVRNRAKRRIRAALSQCDLPPSTDLVMTAKAGVEEIPFAHLTGEIVRAVGAAHQRSNGRTSR